MQSAGLIVCETRGAWAAALRRILGAGPHLLRETRSLAECADELSRAPASIVALELRPERVEETLGRLAGWQSEFPDARVIVVADRALAACEPLARELGAVHFTTSPRQLGGVATIIRRHLAAAPRPDLTWRERIDARLPWSRHRTTADAHHEPTNPEDRHGP